ncbi:MAG: efflux RND transporter periplasmic adaptor subunit [Luteolibacter sp.]
MKISTFLKRLPIKLTALIIPLALFLLGWWFGLPPAKESATTASAGEVWTCSMHPQIRQPEFGLCPICNMDLIILDDDGAGGLREISINPEAAALLDLRVTPVVRAPAAHEVRLFGRISADERRIATITSRVAGRLDRLFVDFTGARVTEGDHLAEIYSPDLLVTQRELIEARRAWDAMPTNTSDPVRDTRSRLLNAAREKLRLLQFSDEQIAEIETLNQPTERLTLRTTKSGIVTARMANAGDYVNTGDVLFKIADLSGVWLNLEAYESDLPWLRYGQDLEFGIDALPGRTFHGRIVFIDPSIDPVRRVSNVRVNVENPDLALKPGMFARASVQSTTVGGSHHFDPSLAGKWISPMHPEIIKDTPGSCDICGMALVPIEEFGIIADASPGTVPLLVPATAVLQTGPRAIVYVRLPEEPTPVFEGREIILGPRAGDHFIVASGLSEGELVVTRGAFKLDSELQIKGRPSMMNPDAGLTERPAHDAPESLAAQWQSVPRALHRFLKNPDPAGIGEIKQLIETINTSQLQPDELSLWNEFSRRLLNDLELVTREIANHPEQAAAQTARAIERAGRFLGLPYHPVATTADPQRAAELRTLLAAYLPVAQALADDDDPTAQQAAETLAATAQGEIKPLAQAVASAADIKTRRTAFQPLSDHLIALIREHGTDAVGNAYVVHCPMAFGDTGGDWLSAKPEVLNPYYGDRMLTCGTVTDTLSTQTKPE